MQGKEAHSRTPILDVQLDKVAVGNEVVRTDLLTVEYLGRSRLADLDLTQGATEEE